MPCPLTRAWAINLIADRTIQSERQLRHRPCPAGRRTSAREHHPVCRAFVRDARTRCRPSPVEVQFATIWNTLLGKGQIGQTLTVRITKEKLRTIAPKTNGWHPVSGPSGWGPLVLQ